MKAKCPRIMLLLATTTALVMMSVVVFATIASAEWIPDDGESAGRQTAVSHRLIVELEAPPLAVYYRNLPGARAADGTMSIESAAAQAYVQQLQAEQAAFVSNMQASLPNARVSTYINELGAQVEQTFQVAVNAVVVDAGFEAGEVEADILRRMPGVKNVHADYAYHPQLYTSTQLINADSLWPMLGGQDMAGSGVKIASMDGGIHKDAPMFSGEGFSYPPHYPVGGLGLSSNNNGKIIASRVYFRSWDPPAPGDENPWPGERGTSHGVHTAAIAAGNRVEDATYLGTPLPPMSGVAPGAWVGSYRVFYQSVRNDGSFYTAEGLAALEDIVRDGMDVINNSWGGGPGRIGGEFDVLDTALSNAVRAGLFVSMSAGNAGPFPGTGDHPTMEYMNVAATTSGGTYAAGRFYVTGPGTVITETLLDIPFAAAVFGAPLGLAQVFTYTYVAAANVDPANVEGCNPWPANTFQGRAALISRGTCEFGVKVLHAEEAGALFVVIHNTQAGGDDLISMGPGEVGGQVTIPSIFIGYTAGIALTEWQQQHPTDAEFGLNTIAFQIGNEPDQVADFSSRGPSTRNTLKPDIAAPGVNIMSQGYAPGVTGEARHLGFGQVSGTSMAAPHVAGAAALVLQRYPHWTPAAIKSALMSTAKYTDIYNADGTPAQPIDIGAGRLDLLAVMDPGVILTPSAADLGLVITGTTPSVTFLVQNITDAAETYDISTLFTGNGFAPTQTTTLQGVTVSPQQVTLNPGQTVSVTVEFDPAQGLGFGFNQGYIVMQGSQHQAHLPFFARVVEGLSGGVLIIDADMSGALARANYSGYYTQTVENLGVTYDYWDVVDHLDFTGETTLTIPDFSALARYDAVIIFTGDHYQPDGTYAIPTPFTRQDMNLLNEYAQAGGKLFVMGQDATWVLAESFFQGFTLRADRIQDSVTNGDLPEDPVIAIAGAPEAFRNVYLDLSGPGFALGMVELLGANEAPPVENAGLITGVASFAFNNFTNRLAYSIQIEVAQPYTITGAHIHAGAAGEVGGVLHGTFPFDEPQVVTDTLAWSGSVVLTPDQATARLAGGLYLNIHSTENPGGEIRGQVPSSAVEGDGAGNQRYIDELATDPNAPNPGQPPWLKPYAPVLKYAGPDNLEDGVVAMAHRDQPSLERPGLSYLGRSIFTSFGLEGVNNDVGATSREELLSHFFSWAWDEPTVTVTHTAEITTSEFSAFEVGVTSPVTGTEGVSYRWDFGDGSGITPAYPIPQAIHRYAECGDYTVRAEVTTSWGNRAIGVQDITVTACQTVPEYIYYLPLVLNEEVQ